MVAARGSLPSLDERLDVSLNEDGTLKASHSDLPDMPDTGGVNADHDARYVKKSGDTMTGNLGMASGKTVDGRDVSQDGAKLDGIEQNATQDQTPQEILTALKTVDGHNSGLDADTVDGQHMGNFAALQLLTQGSFQKTHGAYSGGAGGQESTQSWNDVYIDTTLSGAGIIVFSYDVSVTWTKQGGHEGHLVINYHKHKWSVREESYVNWTNQESGNVSRKLAFDGQIWAYVSNPGYAHNDYVNFTITVNYKIYQLNTA